MTENRFFAASVGGAGFCSRFGEIFSPDRYDAVYIIKGGPGTGKSTFMKKIGEEAERRGFEPEYYFCSSDVDSLDGVVIREAGVCVLDGTAPHVTDPKYPGACERIVDFSAAFDVRKLRGKREEIARLSALSGEMYSRAYSSLRAARELLAEQIRVRRAAFLEKKAASFAHRALAGMTRGEMTDVGLSTVCSRGICRLPTMITRAKKVFSVDEAGGAGYLLIDEIEKYAKANGLCAAVSRDPVCREHADGVFFEKDGVCFALLRDGEEGQSDGKTKAINVRRFVSAEAEREARPYLRLVKKLYAASIFAAVRSLGDAARAHSELEEIYKESTDFSVVDGLCEKVKREIFEN